MAKVAPPMIDTVARNAPLRPSRSPITPKMIAPSGRKAKPAANNPSAAISAAVGSSPAKNTFEMVVASAPKMKKSYHSNAVPAADATTTRFIDQGLCSATRSSPVRQLRVSGSAQRRKRRLGELAATGDERLDHRRVSQGRCVSKA